MCINYLEAEEKKERNEAVAVVQLLECLFSMHEAVCSISRTAQPRCGEAHSSTQEAEVGGSSAQSPSTT